MAETQTDDLNRKNDDDPAGSSSGSSSSSSFSKIPITIITGFAGAGKTTLILQTLPQLRRAAPGYRLALIKNEIGDVAVDSALAAAAEMAGARELLGDCICCTNVGQVGDALAGLAAEVRPDRVIVETSGSAEPLKLALEVNRLATETGRYVLDGVVSVVDAENWGGYASTSYTAKLQAQQTDLIVINKWEGLGEREFDVFLDRLGDLDVDTPQVKSDRGWISKDVLFGFDEKMARTWLHADDGHGHEHDHEHDPDHKHENEHKSEVECISVTLNSEIKEAGIDLAKLENLLRSAPKDEVYRIKAVLYSNSSPKSSDGAQVKSDAQGRGRYLLNWSFGRWNWSHDDVVDENAPILRMSIFTAPYESKKWMGKIETGSMVALDAGVDSNLEVKRVQ